MPFKKIGTSLKPFPQKRVLKENSLGEKIGSRSGRVTPNVSQQNLTLDQIDFGKLNEVPCFSTSNLKAVCTVRYKWGSTLTFFIMFTSLITTWSASLSFSFLDDKTENWRGYITCPGSHNYKWENWCSDTGLLTLSPLYHVLLYLSFDFFTSVAKSQSPYH